ncbi:hypothetical protein [Pseudoalteromonas luteoviolacea]
MRFEQDVIDMLQDIAWWNWPVEKVTEYLDAIVGNDLEALIRAK